MKTPACYQLFGLEFRRNPVSRRDSNAEGQVKQFVAPLPNAQNDRYTPYKEAPLSIAEGLTRMHSDTFLPK
jgi:hypothetical protein